MKRKLLFLLLPLIPIVIGIIFAIYYSIPRLEYIYSEEYNGYLVSYAYGDNKEYEIPSSYKGMNVVGISTRAFYRHHSLERITFEKEENILFIGKLSFSECESLKEISIRYANVIEKNAFAFDSSLERIELKAKNIGGSAFFECSSLSEVTLNMGVESIGSYAFSRCTSLKELNLPASVYNVFDGAFNHSGLEVLNVPLSLRDNAYLKSLDYVKYY